MLPVDAECNSIHSSKPICRKDEEAFNPGWRRNSRPYLKSVGSCPNRHPLPLRSLISTGVLPWFWSQMPNTRVLVAVRRKCAAAKGQPSSRMPTSNGSVGLMVLCQRSSRALHALINSDGTSGSDSSTLETYFSQILNASVPLTALTTASLSVCSVAYGMWSSAGPMTTENLASVIFSANSDSCPASLNSARKNSRKLPSSRQENSKFSKPVEIA